VSDREEIIERIVDFLIEIGIDVEDSLLPVQTFLPGIYIENGRMLIDRLRLLFPGDLLHEAGHLAVIPSDIRATLTGEMVLSGTPMETIEAQAMAWSYAAVRHLGLDPRAVFHPAGYKGRSAALLQGFELGVYIGLQDLENAELTFTPTTAFRNNCEGYPRMIRWVRE